MVIDDFLLGWWYVQIHFQLLYLLEQSERIYQREPEMLNIELQLTILIVHFRLY